MRAFLSEICTKKIQAAGPGSAHNTRLICYFTILIIDIRRKNWNGGWDYDLQLGSFAE